MAQDLLIELGTEELPPKALKTFSDSFSQSILKALQEADLAFNGFKAFATPRRLALVVNDLVDKQEDKAVEKLGPAVAAAYDKEGNPSKAAEGFARSNGIAFSDLIETDTPKGPRLAARSVQQGQTTAALLPAIIEDALKALPIPKRMRWGASRNEFVRPVHWLVVMMGDDVVDTEILGIKSSNQSRGHRFHSPGSITVNAANYEAELATNKVVADYDKRQQQIADAVNAEATRVGGHAVIDEDLLHEVTALVEWPVALTGTFEERFLEVPAQALISSMKEHQKYFHLLDTNDQLMPNFITVSNIESSDSSKVIDGNERVIRPRLSDAAFFFETDKKQTLESRCEQLKKIVFQKDLGTVYEKTQRIAQLAAYIAEQVGFNSAKAERAGLLCKSDLVTEMVFEFTDLQGTMAHHYALNDNEDAEIAQALQEQYLPKGAGDALPETQTGIALALADRVDTLIGIFGIGQQPTGNKDPFALRRASLGILNIIVEKDLPLDLKDLFEKARSQFGELKDVNVVENALSYTIERFRAHYQAQSIKTEVYLAVAARNISNPLDFDQRVQAVNWFSQQDEASALASANKRVANILAKNAEEPISDTINDSLLTETAEQALVEQLNASAVVVEAASADANYRAVLEELTGLKDVVDNFFDNVMVMADDATLKANRLAILQQLRNQFLRVADVSLLAAK
ncbi:Glycine--tRNA ligase beta subunit [BD1-7 clade bacterium]|uniref:Glycine--tRNA ligase beta subunit n=1 Tax=BD1-7 clade bacterium TaxID=2029982 RepID=A0A5S9N1F9_9GAMM|nr:Glycine--tRNA ligase beta subunit [BD1-7 clade bacterium]